MICSRNHTKVGLAKSTNRNKQPHQLDLLSFDNILKNQVENQGYSVTVQRRMVSNRRKGKYRVFYKENEEDNSDTVVMANTTEVNGGTHKKSIEMFSPRASELIATS